MRINVELPTGFFVVDKMPLDAKMVCATKAQAIEQAYPGYICYVEELNHRGFYQFMPDGNGVLQAIPQTNIDTSVFATKQEVSAKADATAVLEALMQKSNTDHTHNYSPVEHEHPYQLAVVGKGLSTNDFDNNYKQKLDALMYTEPVLTFSAVPAPGAYELGTVINSVALSWNVSKPELQSLNLKRNGISLLQNPALRNYTDNSAVNSNATYTLDVNDGAGYPASAKTASLAYTFKHKRYWGVSDKTVLAIPDILALSGELADARTQTRTFNCSGGKYFYFAWPVGFGTPVFKIGGLENTDFVKQTISFTNALNYTSNFDVWRINNIQTSDSITVEVL